MRSVLVHTVWVLAGLSACSDDASSTSGESNVVEYQPGCDAVAGATYALGGTVLTPDGPLEGWVVVENEKIVKITENESDIPEGAAKVATDGIISPGLIDLHNHVTYNFLPLWDSGRRWQNRYEWQMDAGYAAAIQTPHKAVKSAKKMCEAIKYGEFKALVGGTTTIEDADDLACTRSWVRNVEFTNFCADHVEERVSAIYKMAPAAAEKLNTQIASGEVKSFIAHVAEGVDEPSRKEFDDLKALNLAKPEVAIIHGVALDETQLAEMGTVGMKLVWSPLSNMILYGQTANIPAAVAAGVTVSLAPDWSPSGSSNLLGELKVADRINQEQFAGALTEQQLWEMVTANPADIVAWTDKVGRIREGLFADLVVIRGDRTSPYRAMIDAKPADVLLTTVSGSPFYGDTQILDTLGQAEKYEVVDACGEQRGLRTTESNPGVPQGDQTLDAIAGAFAEAGVEDVASLFQCDSAPESAFAAE